jgi:hypothetical protein
VKERAKDMKAEKYVQEGGINILRCFSDNNEGALHKRRKTVEGCGRERREGGLDRELYRGVVHAHTHR